jgi:hypothetical protein
MFQKVVTSGLSKRAPDSKRPSKAGSGEKIKKKKP